MKSIKYRWWKIFLSLIVLLVPTQQLNATVTQFTDEKGTIHINNIGNDKTKSQDEVYNASVEPKSIEVVNHPEQTPSNIFPEPGGTNALASNQNFQASTPE